MPQDCIEVRSEDGRIFSFHIPDNNFVQVRDQDGRIVSFRITNRNNEINQIVDPMILTKNTPLVEAFLITYASGEQSFSVQGHQYDPVYRYEILKTRNIKINKVRRVNLSRKLFPPIVYVYKTSGVCEKCRRKRVAQRIETVFAKVKNSQNQSCQIYVFYCKNCKKYFSNEQALACYERRYGSLMMKRCNDNLTDNNANLNFRPDSLLSRSGYKADGSQSREERRAIIRRIISEDEQNAYVIINHLSNLIEYRRRKENAVQIWSEDLEYTIQYIANNQKEGTQIDIGDVQLRPRNDRHQ